MPRSLDGVDLDFRQLFDAIGEALVVGEGGTIVHANPVAIRLLGRDPTGEALDRILGERPDLFASRVEAAPGIVVARLRSVIDFAITLSSMAEAVLATDPAGRVAYLNPRAEAVTGWTQDDARGRPAEEVLVLVDAEGRPVENPCKRALSEGVSVSVPPGTSAVARDGRRRAIEDTASPIRDAGGALRGCIVVFRDVEASHREDERRRYLNGATELLASTIDFRATLASVARLAVPRIADWCVIDLLEDDGSLSMVAAEHVEPGKADQIRRLAEEFPPRPEDHEGVWGVIEDGRARLHTHTSVDVWDAPPRYRELVRGLGLSSVMIVPLLARDRVLGTITFVSGTEAYDEEDLSMARELGVRAGLAIENALLFRAESEARQTAEAAERRFRDLVNELEGGIVWERTPSGFTFVGDPAATLLGFPVSAWFDDPDFLEHHLPEADRPRFRQAVDAARRHGEAKCEHRIVTAGGRELWVATGIRAVADGLRGLSVDIDRLKLAEASIREQVRHRDLAVELGRFAVRAHEPEVLFRRAAETAVEGAMLDGVAIHVGDGDEARRVVVLGEPPEPGRALVIPIVAERRLGELLARRSTPFGPNDVGFLQAVVGVLAGGLEHGRAERALRESEARLRMIADSVSDHAILLLARDGRIQSWNAGAREVLGYDGAELVGHHFALFCPEERRQDGSPERELLTAATTGRSTDEGWRVRKDGSRFWAVVLTTRLVDADGRLQGFSMVMRDVTEQRMAEEERARLLRDAQEAIRVRDEFLSIASHELKTPLTSLTLDLQSLHTIAERSPEAFVSERSLAKLRKSIRQVDRLAKLVNELLDVSRITSRRLLLGREMFDLGLLVREVATRFREESLRSGSPIRLDLADDVIGAWDRLRIEQIITNLVSNALKYGRGRPIEVAIWEEGDRAYLSVTDHGIGIHPEHIARIFDRFERAVSSRSYGGLGLGLYIVRQIVDAMGGKISVRSAPGTGSTFTVELPLQAASVTHPTHP